MPVVECVQPGSLVFLACGCRGYRMPSRPDTPVLVIVEQPCADHAAEGRPRPRYLDPLATVSPFTPERSDGD